jgi:hypothetical protein
MYHSISNGELFGDSFGGHCLKRESIEKEPRNKHTKGDRPNWMLPTTFQESVP